MSSTRWQNKTASPLDIRAFGDSPPSSLELQRMRSNGQAFHPIHQKRKRREDFSSPALVSLGANCSLALLYANHKRDAANLQVNAKRVGGAGL